MNTFLSGWTTRLALAALAAALTLPSATTWANGTTVTVDDDKAQCPNAQYSGPDAIQNAYDATSGDVTIRVCFGTYHPFEGKHYPNRNIELNGLPANGLLPLIDATGSGRPAVLHFENNTLAIDSMRIKGAMGVNEPAVRVNQAALVLTNSVVEGGTNGVELVGEPRGTLVNNTISQAEQHGIFIESNRTFTIANNNIHHNGAAGIAMKQTAGDNNPTLINSNTIANNKFGVLLEEIRAATLSQNTISENTTGVALMANTSGNLVSKNVITNSGAEGLFLDKRATKNTLDQNVVQNNKLIDVADFQLLQGDPADGPNSWALNICDTSLPKGLCVHERGEPTPVIIDTTPVPMRPSPTPARAG